VVEQESLAQITSVASGSPTVTRPASWALVPNHPKSANGMPRSGKANSSHIAAPRATGGMAIAMSMVHRLSRDNRDGHPRHPIAKAVPMGTAIAVVSMASQRLCSSALRVDGS